MTKARGSRIAERDPDEILPEYDFSKGRRNPYAKRYHEWALAAVLDADVAKRFRTARAVNEALRSVAAKPKRRSNPRSKRRGT